MTCTSLIQEVYLPTPVGRPVLKKFWPKEYLYVTKNGGYAWVFHVTLATETLETCWVDGKVISRQF